MMRWFLFGWGKTVREQRQVDADKDVRIAEAERHAADVEARGDKVYESISRRVRRNHWTETVTRIARGGAP